MPIRTLTAARAAYDEFKARGLKLDMTRGKPSPEQLDLAEGMLTLPGNRDHLSEAGEDSRNYGNLQGLAEARRLMSHLVDAPPDQVVVGDNSSLALMHDCLAWATLRGVPGSPAPWYEATDRAFLCPVPGYDRHFGLCEVFGLRMIPVPLTGEGPDMDVVERLAADPAVKGMWCVPRYSNPTGETYSDETIGRLARMETGAPDFRLFWDNAYSVHHLTDDDGRLADILALTAEAGHADRPFVFASTSKVTLAGAGLSVFASSTANVRWYLDQAKWRTIGPDKPNQLRHVRFLRDGAGIARHMKAHREILEPKFDAVLGVLDARLGPLGIARWTVPKGGYFISLDVPPGTAKRVVQLAREAGLALTPAGSTWPHGEDPDNGNLRLAPTFPTRKDVEAAAEGIAVCVELAVAERAPGA